MTDRNQWNRIEPVVRKVIHEWDPYGLLEIGAPKDEWDREILQIVGRVSRIDSPSDAVKILSDVFTEAFQPEGFGQDECAEVGRKLYDALKDAGLIKIEEQRDQT